MNELRDLYQEIIFDHNRSPRNFGRLDGANRTIEGYNPLCGDQLVLDLLVDENDIIEDIRFDGQGCAISTASASIMTEMLKGKPIAEAEQIFRNFQNLIVGQPADEDFELGKLEVLIGVREYPARVKCAMLPWHTVHAAMQGVEEAVTTE
ncbi:SUF system NifU family Fe-S cluster assembly protein [Gammaproteobacteria bacterium]|nr:SUF system NifU family Fe-S cluster assembly protein [Gammaproteobacteria bacterium]